ncbi:MAG: NAD(P)-binding protein [Desulfobacterales bacterium]|nr:MAG: NAD(P)-binding protein [Desulfobacterales bacterium]
MKTIRILGGGISGLTAAINLSKAGIDVEVHERKNFCGKHTEDFQFVENWTFDEDVLDNLRAMNIQIDFYCKPWFSQEFLSPTLKSYVGISSEPLMYLVKRGQSEDSIDHALARRAAADGVKIIYESKLKISDADVVASGIKTPSFVAMGVKFPFNHPDRSIVLLDDTLSYKMYSYFIVNDQVGEIVCVNPVDLRDHRRRLDDTVDRFEGILKAEISPLAETFSATCNFYFLKKAMINKQYYIGEAAGFQDCLAGFGMRYAFKSGYLAAKSIIEDCDYDHIWKEDLLKPMEISAANRKIYEKLSNAGYEKLIDLLKSSNPVIRKLLGGEDLRQVMKKIYNHSLSFLLRFLLSH